MRDDRRHWKKTVSLFSIIIFLLSTAISTMAHPGRTDSRGGHTEKATGIYHYHNGGYGTASSPKPTATPKPAAAPAPEQMEISVILDGEKIEFDQPPENINGSIMIPLRDVVEKIGCKIEWDGETETVYINEEGIQPDKHAVKTKNINIHVNNEAVIYDNQPPVNKNERIRVDIPPVAEKLGYGVTWDSDSQTVYIDRKTE